jgi:hypothetical protein
LSSPQTLSSTKIERYLPDLSGLATCLPNTTAIESTSPPIDALALWLSQFVDTTNTDPFTDATVSVLLLDIQLLRF